ncbi:MAG: hypothetical protein WCF67_24055 [Chitinophagaceae bacterium]
MPVKLLVWNIQNFTLNKIDWTIGDTVYDDFSPTRNSYKFGAQYNTLRNDYILNNVSLTDPDIFIVIEVVSGRGPKGSLITSKGAAGVTTLLARLRTLNNNWCLVPPLKLTDEIQVGEIEDQQEHQHLLELLGEGSYTEGIGVFFRKDRVSFTGPYVWPNQPANNNAHKIAVPANGAVSGPYPDIWQACLPVGNHFAGQFEFRDNTGEKLFPAQGSRRPFFTTFRELHGNQRDISIASVHFPPQKNPAVAALNNLATFLSTNVPLGNNAAMLIVGDYNINPYADAMNSLSAALLNTGFTPLINRDNKRTSTMYYTNSNATPFVYIKDRQPLDNIAVRAGSSFDANDLDLRIINRVVESSILFTDLNVIQSLPTKDLQDEIFRKPLNFKKIGPNPGTSDHLAVFFQM